MYALGVCDTYAYSIITSCITIYLKSTWSHWKAYFTVVKQQWLLFITILKNNPTL